MLRTVIASVAAFALAVPAVALACGDGKTKQAAWQPVSVEELAQMKASEAKLVILDANSQSTRASMGVIPSATLLSSASQYDVKAELPEAKDTSLVFYCANTRCTAAPTAAERAAEAGYRHVYVLPEGIKGWVEAGQPVARPERGES